MLGVRHTERRMHPAQRVFSLSYVLSDVRLGDFLVPMKSAHNFDPPSLTCYCENTPHGQSLPAQPIV